MVWLQPRHRVLVVAFLILGGIAVIGGGHPSGAGATDLPSRPLAEQARVASMRDPRPGLSAARGSGRHGTSAGCSGLWVATGADVASLVSSNAPGTTFCFASGTYHLTRPVVPKTNDVFQGEGEGVTIIDAGREIAPLFHALGSYWVASRVESLPAAGSPCQSGYLLCRDPNDIYFDGAPLVRAASLLALGTGKFFYDLSTQRLWIASNPSGHVVEAAVLPFAWQGWFSGSDNVRIDGLTVEHVGGTAVQGRASWTISDSEVRWNHVDGVIGALTITNDYLHDNGQAGYEENCECPHSSTPHYFVGNEVAFNNYDAYAGYQTSYDASGMKFMQTGDIIVSGNYVHDNGGPGLWSDTNVINATYSNNRVLRNKGPGIEAEVSYSHVIANNDIEGNGDAGILIADSGPVEVSGNTLADNTNGIEETQIDRGSGTLGPYALKNIDVHDNAITMREGWNGLKNWQLGTSPASDSTWRHNSYYVSCSGNSSPFIWPSGSDSHPNLSWSEWQAAGNDATGSFSCVTSG
jgi:parallel beta-helix repeat protein